MPIDPAFVANARRRLADDRVGVETLVGSAVYYALEAAMRQDLPVDGSATERFLLRLQAVGEELDGLALAIVEQGPVTDA